MSAAIAKFLKNASAGDRIALAARDVHLQLWNRRRELSSGVTPVNPVDLLEPGMALDMLGFEVVTDEFLGEVNEGGRRVQAAGLIDWNNKIVRISPNVSFEEMRFTAAHELGHAILHPGMHGLHRDRPVSGPTYRKEAREIEADAFASSFLMPERLVRRRFLECFGLEQFYLDETTAFLLCCATWEQVKRKFRTTRDLSNGLATTGSFGDRQFESLRRHFRVSPSAMAIRLEELKLVC